MSEKSLWFGYLDAGEKSSPVVMDTRLNTANPNTVYLFHFKRDEIIEYRRDIIEPKLRALGADAEPDEKSLKSAFTKVRADFIPRGGKVAVIPEKASKPAAKKAPPVAVDNDEDEEIDALIGDDDNADWDED